MEDSDFENKIYHSPYGNFLDFDKQYYDWRSRLPIPEESVFLRF